MRSILAGLAVVAVAGCGRGTTARYTVDWAARDSSGVAVRLELEGARGDSVVLDAGAPRTVTGLRVIGARDGDGAALPVRLMTRHDPATGLDLPRLVVARGASDRVIVDTRVTVGVRDGNPHMGYSGQSFGGQGEGFAFTGGVGLFLVPEPRAGLRQASVRFVMPPGGTAVTPWVEAGGEFQPGVGADAGASRRPGGSRRYVADDLMGAALGLGRFEIRTLDLGGTRFRWCVASSLPEPARARVVAALDSVAATATRVFGRGPGPTYTVVAVPETRDGDDVTHQGWATGNGGTLWPLTATRLHRVASELMDAYLAYPPYRTVIRDRSERWFGEGVRRIVAWRAVARAGLVDDDDVARALAYDWVNARDDEHAEWNLERAYDGTSVAPLTARTVAPFSVLALDREVRDATGGAETLADVVRRVFAGRVARSLWGELPAPRDGRWTRFRARYARGEPAPLDDPAFALARPTLEPAPARGAVREHLLLAYTGSTYGYLENCGCRVNQAGGMPKRRTLLDRLRATGEPLAVLDAGNAFAKPEHPDPPGFLAQEEQGLYFRLMREMGYGAAAVNEAELAYGPDYFAAHRGRDVPFVAANVRAAPASRGARGAPAPGTALAPPWTPVRAGTVRLGVIGVVEPARAPRATETLERRAGDYAIGDPVDAVARALPEARRASDLVVAMGRLSPWTVRRLAAACPDLDVVISTAPEAAIRIQEEGEPVSLESEDEAGFVGRTLVLYTFLGSFGLNSVRLGLDAERRIASAQMFSHWLDDTVSNDPAVRGQMTAFYERVGRAEAAQASVPPLFADDEARMTGTYVGAAACSSCHAAEYAQWHETPHASAWRTLLDAHRHYQPRCVSCHVVGLGTATGYVLGDDDPRLVNVQCEVCHGPGGDHVRGPSAANIRRVVPEAVCLECHDAEHSDDFVYDSKLPLVVHGMGGGAGRGNGVKR